MGERPVQRHRRRTAGRLSLSPPAPAPAHELPNLATTGQIESGPSLPQQGDDADQILFTAEQAASLLQVRPSWLRRRAAARVIPCRYVGKHLRFARQDIDEIAAASRRRPMVDR
ncbi:hypothetical protein GCM10022267_89370 [Lentzea roselyniae]|uniref:Helix-turn-helix domain-containing protein n=1 Tax=Lentzea roselyniae TaxID=531940 RepID=A0ABP7CHQ7_9PSEU